MNFKVKLFLIPLVQLLVNLNVLAGLPEDCSIYLADMSGPFPDFSSLSIFHKVGLLHLLEGSIQDGKRNPAAEAYLELQLQKGGYFKDLFDAKKDGIKLSKFRGFANKGIYQYVESTDNLRGAHTVKVLLELELADLVREIKASLIGEIMGGPKVYRFGLFDRKRSVYGKRYSQGFIDMETLFPSEEAINFKSDKLTQLIKSPNGPHSDLAPLITKIADQFADTLENGILPGDPDWLISTSGNVRWIDMGFWEFDPSRDLRFLKMHAEIVVESMLCGYGSSKYLTAANTTNAEIFLRRIYDRVQQGQAATESEKENYLSELERLSKPCLDKIRVDEKR